nr:hypothetical protein BaRGS_008662 [Batillaria attramentaria]
MTTELASLKADNNHLKQELESLKQENANLKTDLTSRLNVADKSISFHVRVKYQPFGSGAVLKAGEVLTNNGDAYDVTSGIFTAPVNGTYIFLASIAVSSPTASLHLEFIPNAGIRLHNVAIADTGTYSVHVNINLHGSLITETPSNETLSSTFNENGHFLLSVPHPVVSGDYTCNIDDTSPASLCVQSGSPLQRGATLSVDGIQAQMTLLESKMKFFRESQDKEIA